MIVEIAIHASRNFRSLGAESRTAAFQEDNYDDVTDVGFGVGGEPSETCARVGAGSSLAQNIFLAEVYSQATGGAELHGALHAVGNFGDQWGDIQAALYHGLEIRETYPADQARPR